MSDQNDIELLGRLMDAMHAANKLPQGAVIMPKDYQLVATERFEESAKRLRGIFDTTLVEDFANYYARNVHADKLSHAPIFVDMEPLYAVASLDWMVDDDRPGHMQHKAVCRPKALPDWMTLRRLHGEELTQDAAVDTLEDFASVITAHDDSGQGMPPAALIAAFRNAQITKQSERSQTLEDSRVERSAMEKIDANASRRAPSKLVIQIVPYEGFKTRSVLVRVIIRVRNDAPVFIFRIVGLETLEHIIAHEFVDIVQTSVTKFFRGNDTPAIYVGKFNQ